MAESGFHKRFARVRVRRFWRVRCAVRNEISFCVRLSRDSRARELNTYRDRLRSWTLGCVKRAPMARGDQDAGITQPRDHSLADPCIYKTALGDHITYDLGFELLCHDEPLIVALQ